MDKIARIRQEIERRKKYESENYHDRKPDGRPNEGWAESLAIMGELEELLSFLDTLQQEQQDFPTTDEQMKEFLATHPKIKVPEKYKNPDWLFKKQEQQEEPDKSLEEAAEEYANINCDNYVDYDCNICYIEEGMRVAFKAGAEWQKSQMLKDAVESEAEELYNDGESQCVISVGTYFEPGDKVYVLKAEEG